MANVHPETGKEIPRVFRMSSFLLVNIPIAIGLALTAPTVKFSIFLLKFSFEILSEFFTCDVSRKN